MWSRRDPLDLRNGIILTFLAIIVVLYSKVVHQTQVSEPYFSPGQAVYDQVDQKVYETETAHFDGLVKYTRTNSNATPNLLVLVLTKDATSWGRDVDAPPRTFHDFLDLLTGTNLNMTTTSLALWTSSHEEYQLFRTATTHLNLARLSLFWDPSTDPTDEDRGGRHNSDHAIQTARRARVARYRNKLLLHALGTEPHLLWLDADVQFLSPGIVQLMLTHGSTNPAAGIITARCQDGPTYNYDKNAWAGLRPAPKGGESADARVAAEEAAQKARLVDELIDGTGDRDLIALDAVGGTILYMRASLVWEGLNFPSYYVVGTRWARDGWDGIETEGVCYAARYLEGGGCYVLGGEELY